MTKLGPDERAGYESIGVLEGYDCWAVTYDGDPNPLIALEEKVTLELIGDVEGQRVLDLGCGTGRYCSLLARLGARAIGLDRSGQMLKHARRKSAPDSRYELGQATVNQLPLPDRSIDLVVCALTVGHLDDLEPLVGEAARVLRRAGRLVITDVHPYWPISGHDYVEFFDPSGQEYRIPVYPHLIEEYWRLGRELGLYVEDIQEPRIDGRLIEDFPSLIDLEGVPLGIVLALQKAQG
jgi:SAM-dependent methyltransferase